MRSYDRLGPLAAGTGLLVGAGFKTGSAFGAALLGAGLIVLGAWLAVEVRRSLILKDSKGDPDGTQD